MGVYKVKGKKEDRWYIDFCSGGQRFRKVIGSKKDAEYAEQIYKVDSWRGELRVSKNKTSLKKLCEQYLEYEEINGKKSLKRDVIIVNSFLNHFHYLNVTQIDPLKIEGYKKKRLEDGVKPSTVNRELACIKHMFNLAKKWKIIHENPAGETKLLKEEKYKIRILEKVEADLLIRTAADYLKPILIVALNTGMRMGEILGLSWSDIDFVNYNMHVRNTKSGKDRTIPMNSLVAGALKKQDMSHEFVFKSAIKKEACIKSVSRSFKTALRKSGIEKLRFHDLRHTAASWMVVNCGIDLVTVKEILGHSSIEMTMIYCHPSQESKRRAVEGLEKILSAESFSAINLPQMVESTSVK
ncbi:Tyrosine recombinase XerC [subsurface metagenome]